MAHAQHPTARHIERHAHEGRRRWKGFNLACAEYTAARHRKAVALATWTRLGVLAAGLLPLAATPGIAAQSHVRSWGVQVTDSQWNEESFVEVAAGEYHTVARLGDGSVVAWGDNGAGQCNVPALPGGFSYVEIAAGGYHTVARLSDGSVVAWGNNGNGQCNVPALPSGLSYVEISGGGYHAVARLSDGSVAAWGKNDFGQCNVPALPSGLSYVEISAGEYHTVARLSDGSVVAWGYNGFGQCNVPALPSGLSYVEVGASREHSVARYSLGTQPTTLEGLVCLDPSERIPLKNVDVQLLHPTNHQVLATLTTDNEGKYFLNAPLSTGYRIRARLSYTDPGTNQTGDAYAYLQGDRKSVV